MTDDLERRLVDIDDPVSPVPSDNIPIGVAQACATRGSAVQMLMSSGGNIMLVVLNKDIAIGNLIFRRDLMSGDANLLEITNYEWIYEDDKLRVKTTLSDGTVIESDEINNPLSAIMNNCSVSISCEDILEVIKDQLMIQTGCTRAQLFGTRRENPEAWQSEMMQNPLISEERINMLRAPGRTRMMTYQLARDIYMSVSAIHKQEKCVICEDIMHNSFPPDFPDKYKLCCKCHSCLEWFMTNEIEWKITGFRGEFKTEVEAQEYWTKYHGKFLELFLVQEGNILQQIKEKRKENGYK